MNKTEALKTRTGLSSYLQRPIFKPGLLLEDEDLSATVDYARNMMRLMFKSLFGCGVVCGLEVKAELTCKGQKLVVSVERGVALDCMGDVIEVPASTPVEYEPGCDEKFPPYIWVAVCYHEKCCRPRDVSCSPDDGGHPVQTRSVSGFEVNLYKERPACACTCEQPDAEKPATTDPCACYENDLKGACGCDCDCECVILGKMDTSKFPKDAGKIDEEYLGSRVRRFVRPVSAGYWNDCLKPKSEARSETVEDLSKTLGNLSKTVEELKKRLPDPAV